MPRETMAAKRERALEVARRMNEHYPAAECALVYGGDPFRLTIAVLLSAQTTDKGVNKVTPRLWERYPTPADLASADTPAKTETALLKLYPRAWWGPINHQWVLFGRETCIARNPKCGECFLCDLCPSCGKA